MKLTEEQFELIEAYLNDELSAPDRASFESELAADVELRAEVERQRDIRLGLRAQGIQQMLGRAKQQYEASSSVGDPATPKPSVVRPLWGDVRYWAAAASVIVVLGVGYYFFDRTTSQSADLAYAETSGMNDDLMKSFPTETVPDQTRTAFLEVLRKYKAGKYDQVIADLKTLPADRQTAPYKNYFLGLSYLANQQSVEAIPLLLSAQRAATPAIRQKSEWFLALAYVKNRQPEKARPILTRISRDRANPFQTLAGKVLRKID